MKQLEICVDTVEAGLIAQAAGADRLELCGELAVGGLTPDPGLLERSVRSLKLPLQVMIRPRGGGFCYSDDELATMLESMRIIRRIWPMVRGFVTGALTPEGQLHLEAMKRLQEAAGPHPVTLHRAFDRVRNPEEALEQCVSLGLERILTSGGAADAAEGMDGLARLNRQAAGRLLILPGGGVNSSNAEPLLRTCQVSELHLSGRTSVPIGPAPDDLRWTADAEAIRAVRSILDRFQ